MISAPIVSISQKMFKNPLNGSVWVSSDDYNTRKIAFESIRQIEGIPEIRELQNFEYNSLSNMALTLFESLNGTVPKSYIHPSIWNLKKS